MDLKDFQAAFDALPEEADGEDISNFILSMMIGYMPPEEAMLFLLEAIGVVKEYNDFLTSQVVSETSTCTCPNCTAKREALVRH